ncbi:uncharacterized protein [Antedon mediterranea]|uniref:uncharacterized protein n=1 Tax=Antedon mediterranea TaxID=105859 RepID=UPI003AF644EF
MGYPDFESSSSLTIGVNNNITAQNVIITCSGNVVGNPVPDINLYRDSPIILTQTTLPLTYTIATVSENDGGIYRCEANNTAGTVTNKPIFEQYIYTVGPDEKYVITADVNANPQDVTYVWSSDDVNDTDTNPATFTFIASSVEDNTIYEISVIATNLIGSITKTMWIAVSATNQIESTNSAKITIPSMEKTVEPCNSNTGLIIGMLFVGIFIGAVGLYIGYIIHNKIKKKSLAEKQDTDKKKQDTYMDYVGDTGEQNQTYQDLQHKEEESAYVNVKAGNKNRKGKV